MIYGAKRCSLERLFAPLWEYTICLYNNQRKLVLTLSDPDAVQSTSLDKINSNEFILVAVIGKINEIKIVSKAVFIVKFETGEIRLDIGMNDLKNMKNVD